MSKGVEVEFKLRVAHPEDLDAIARAADAQLDAGVRQVNHFFDTSDLRLRRAGVAVRLRVEGERRILTVKAKKRAPKSGFSPQKAVEREASALAVRIEEETDVDHVLAAQLLNGELPMLGVLVRWSARVDEETQHRLRTLLDRVSIALQGEPLTRYGQFSNVRRRGVWQSGPHRLILECDTATFGDEVHHEIEVEVPDGASAETVEQAFYGLFMKAGVASMPSVGKASRFFAAQAGAALPTFFAQDLPHS